MRKQGEAKILSEDGRNFMSYNRELSPGSGSIFSFFSFLSLSLLLYLIFLVSFIHIHIFVRTRLDETWISTNMV